MFLTSYLLEQGGHTYEFVPYELFVGEVPLEQWLSVQYAASEHFHKPVPGFKKAHLSQNNFSNFWIHGLVEGIWIIYLTFSDNLCGRTVRCFKSAAWITKFCNSLWETSFQLSVYWTKIAEVRKNAKNAHPTTWKQNHVQNFMRSRQQDMVPHQILQITCMLHCVSKNAK